MSISESSKSLDNAIYDFDTNVYKNYEFFYNKIYKKYPSIHRCDILEYVDFNVKIDDMLSKKDLSILIDHITYKFYLIRVKFNYKSSIVVSCNDKDVIKIYGQMEFIDDKLFFLKRAIRKVMRDGKQRSS